MIALSEIMAGGRGGHRLIEMVSQLLPEVPVSALLSEVDIHIIFTNAPTHFDTSSTF